MGEVTMRYRTRVRPRVYSGTVSVEIPTPPSQWAVQEMEIFDSLPPRIRRAIAGMEEPIPSQSALGMLLRGYSEEDLLRSLRTGRFVYGD